MADERFYAALSLFMGILGFFAARATDRMLRRKRPEAGFEDWYTKLEHHAVELCRAHLDVAVIQASLAGLIAQMPNDFTPATFKALGLGEALERAVLAEAERRGLLPAGAVEARETGDSAPGASVLPFPTREGAEPALVWRDGTLRPRGS